MLWALASLQSPLGATQPLERIMRSMIQIGSQLNAQACCNALWAVGVISAVGLLVDEPHVRSLHEKGRVGSLDPEVHAMHACYA